jgi:LacI family transcriptional regulator
VQPTRVIVRASSDSYAVSDPQVAAALKYIRDHAADPILVSDVAKGSLVARRTMERQFGQFMGCTPRQAILNAHMDRAKLLLTETTLKIPAVATQSGFTRNQMFFPAFKKATGLAPGEYRRKYWHGS